MDLSQQQIPSSKKRPKSALGKKFEPKDSFEDLRTEDIQRLTPNLIKTITGVEDLATLEVIEAIFTRIHEISGLEACINLKTLDLIDTGLMRISNLAPVSSTLQRLCLCQQNLSKIEGLQLPHLKELYLNNNRIAKIEGLDGCPRLRKIWLHHNMLTKMENLHPVGELEELWLQENFITKVQGVESLVHLKSLFLGGNKIKDLEDLQRLCSLPSLQELSLADVHFGMNPIVEIEGYRQAALCGLKHLRILDGVEIAGAERAGAEDAYLQQVLRFNDRAQTIEAQFIQEITEIEALRSQSSTASKQLSHEMAASLEELEKLILKGREEVEQEQQRQLSIRQVNLDALSHKFEEIQDQYITEIDKQIANEEKLMIEEDQVFQILEKRVEAERDLALLLSSIQKEASRDHSIDPHTGSQFLGDHTADFQLVNRNFRAAQNPNLFQSRMDSANLLQLYRFYNQRLIDKVTATAAKRPGKGSTETLYFSGSLQEIKLVLTGGLQELPTNPVIAHSDPLLALFLHHHQHTTNFSCLPESGSVGESSLGLLGLIVQGRTFLTNTSKVMPVSSPPPRSPNSLKDIVSLHPGGDCIVQLQYNIHHHKHSGDTSDDQITSSHFLIAKSSGSIFVPEYCMLVGYGPISQDERLLEKDIEKIMQPTNLESDTTETILLQLERELTSEMQFFHQRVWEEVEPQKAQRLWDIDNDMRKKEMAIENLRSQIESERQNQEQMLRNYRNQLSNNNPGAAKEQGRVIAKQARSGRPNSAQGMEATSMLYNR